jgi:hypothetical protein
MVEIFKFWKGFRHQILQLIYVLLDYIDILFHYKSISGLLHGIPQPAYVFVTDRYIPRVDKIAFAIHSLGNKSIVLIVRRRKFSFSDYYSAKFYIRSYYKTSWIIRKLNPKIIHVFSAWNFDLALGLMKKKHLFSGKIVFDDYDILAGMLNESAIRLNYKKLVQDEKYCLENADGLCCRSLESQYAKRVLNYKIRAKRIYFPEYMWDLPIKNESVFSKKLVFIGGFNTAISEFAERIAPLGWTLEIYVGYHGIMPVSQVPQNLILHDAQPPKELIRTLNTFRVALQLPGMILDPNNEIYSAEKYYYAAAGKIFDYLEAGLKVLIADEVFQRWLLWRYGSAIEIESKHPLEDIVRKLSNFELPISETGISANHLTLREQAPRLEKFYNALISDT